MTGHYYEYHFKIEPVYPASEILIAELGELGFESFVENEDGITAYVPEEEYTEDLLDEVQILKSNEFGITHNLQKIERINWNEEWEKNFTPILVDDLCSVRAPFHDMPETKYDIIIEPKMSFGTGHHATTHMMIQHILRNEWVDKSVLDMGCGTGVLAILARMKGAAPVEAIDIDNWCYLNTLENIERNDCKDIKVEEGGAELLEGRKYDVILANINRNILLKDMEHYISSLDKNGSIYFSGFYTEDLEVIKQACEKYDLRFIEHIKRNNWVAAKFSF